MEKWEVGFTRQALKQRGRLPERVRSVVVKAVRGLQEHGVRLKGWDIRKTGDDEYRLRLNYRYRMRYKVIRKGLMKIEVFYVGHRKEAYR